MGAEVELKVLFQKYSQSLLRLTGDEGGTVLSVDVVELQEIRRAVDCVIRLCRGEEVYYRHVEFQAKADPDMAERCFRYNALLLLKLRAPVLTTVVYLAPPASAEAELVYRVKLGGKEVNAWRFGMVRLWEVGAAEALASGAPGLLALVPLFQGGDPAAIVTAAREIRRLSPGARRPDAEEIVWLLAAGRYTGDELARVIGREGMDLGWIKKESLLGQMIAEGEAKGRLEAQRELCLKLVDKHHPALLAQVAPIIAACDDPRLLEAWILGADDQNDEAFASLVAGRDRP